MDLSNSKIYDLIHYKIAFKLKHLLKNKNHSNIIIKGPNNSGKTLLINTVLKDKFGKSKSMVNDKISFLENNNYYIFNFLKNVNKYDIIKVIQEIVYRYDHYNDTIKYIVIDDFNNISKNIQNTIKVLIERKSINARFIMITNNINNISECIKNGCIQINVSTHSAYDKYFYFKKLFHGKYPYNELLLLEDCKKYGIDVIKSKYTLNCDFCDIYAMNIIKIIDFFISDLNIELLRKIIINIKSIDIKLNNFFKKLIDKLSFIVDDKKKLFIIIKEIANYNYIINKSYRDIISLESLFIRLYKIINYEKLL